ncbi:large-conductance mechanosensitive channel protein MscL [Candidatus Uhrbacteria bacterium]|nr:large-conductance mechanosensitive channel protein MscL [Candidatus Uhrbacteria bacterium]
MLGEFRQFIVRGNVMDMAVGVIVGTAFGKIVSSFVSDIVMPPIGLLLGGIDFSGLSVTLRESTETAEALTLNYGLFVNTVVDFLIIAFAVFVAVRQINRFRKREEAKPPEPAEEVLLLREIRDRLAPAGKSEPERGNGIQRTG